MANMNLMRELEGERGGVGKVDGEVKGRCTMRIDR